MPKFGARLFRGFLYAAAGAVTGAITMAIAGGVLFKLGFTAIDQSIYPAMGFLFGFSLPLAIEVSKEMEEDEEKEKTKQ